MKLKFETKIDILYQFQIYSIKFLIEILNL